MSFCGWLEAAHEIEHQLDYIATDSPQAANRIATRLRETFDLLLEMPKLGREGRVTDTREYVFVKM